jgi:nuclear pore complex protein Nup53
LLYIWLLRSSKFTHFQDPAQAEALLGQLSLRSTNILPDISIQQPAGLDTSMAVDSNAAQQSHYGTNAPSVGTPIKLAPSAAAFRRSTGSADKAPRPSLTSSRSWVPGGVSGGGGTIPSSSWPGNAGTGPTVPEGAAMAGRMDASQSRGMLGHVSDLIFGW